MPRKTKPPAETADEMPASLSQLWESHEPGRVSNGVYSIYKTEEGGMHISYRPDGADEDQHLPLPPMMITTLMAASEGRGPMGMLRNLAMARMGG